MAKLCLPSFLQGKHYKCWEYTIFCRREKPFEMLGVHSCSFMNNPACFLNILMIHHAKHGSRAWSSQLAYELDRERSEPATGTAAFHFGPHNNERRLVPIQLIVHKKHLTQRPVSNVRALACTGHYHFTGALIEFSFVVSLHLRRWDFFVHVLKEMQKEKSCSWSTQKET